MFGLFCFLYLVCDYHMLAQYHKQRQDLLFHSLFVGTKFYFIVICISMLDLELAFCFIKLLKVLVTPIYQITSFYRNFSRTNKKNDDIVFFIIRCFIYPQFYLCYSEYVFFIVQYLHIALFCFFREYNIFTFFNYSVFLSPDNQYFRLNIASSFV